MSDSLRWLQLCDARAVRAVRPVAHFVSNDRRQTEHPAAQRQPYARNRTIRTPAHPGVLEEHLARVPQPTRCPQPNVWVRFRVEVADCETSLTRAHRTTSYTYFPDGLLNTVTNINPTNEQFSYDNARRLTGVLNQTSAGGVIDQHTYSLDAVGNRTQLVEKLASE